MLQELNRIGLRVVLDVVYNHVHGNGPVDVNSVYDKVDSAVLVLLKSEEYCILLINFILLSSSINTEKNYRLFQVTI